MSTDPSAAPRRAAGAPARSTGRPRRPERGTGLLSAVLGVACIAAVLGLAVNVTLGLWTRSTVDAIAYDLARDLATAPSGTRESVDVDGAIDRATRSIGPYGSKVTFDVEQFDGDAVVLRVTAPGVALLPSMIDGGPVVGSIDRRIVVRRESP